MPKNLPYIIIDSCLWVTYFSDESPDLAKKVESLINANGSDHEILLPTIVYLETLGTVRGRGHSPQDREERYQKAVQFFDDFNFRFCELDKMTTEKANPLIVSHDLKGADSSIIASALIWEARKLYTNDNQMLKLENTVPGLSVEQPPEPSRFKGSQQPLFEKPITEGLEGDWTDPDNIS